MEEELGGLAQAGAEGICGRVLVVFGLLTLPITEHCR